ncbi:MAG: GTP cyclohydrolase I FolE [Lachnospiraceae bacterium]|jgi:GTP cyclohydrolase I|nr:GTP cyclohydrolase I FolE [Lachnospiraceae bacterium]
MIDEAKVQQAVKLFLEAIGEETKREGLADTPKRISNMCKEIFGGIGKDASEHLRVTFEAEGKGIVMEKEIPFYSVCEHHLVPFFGKAYIAYIPDGRVIGLSKLARAVETYARRPQIQEQLTAQVADAIMENLKPKGVMVMMEAEHLCMSMRGVNKPGTKTMTLVCRGEFEENQALQASFFQMLR